MIVAKNGELMSPIASMAATQKRSERTHESATVTFEHPLSHGFDHQKWHIKNQRDALVPKMNWDSCIIGLARFFRDQRIIDP
jgi:hypothetical protein